VYLGVAGLAQAHEILSCVSAALGNGQNEDIACRLW